MFTSFKDHLSAEDLTYIDQFVNDTVAGKQLDTVLVINGTGGTGKTRLLTEIRDHVAASIKYDNSVDFCTPIRSEQRCYRSPPTHLSLFNLDYGTEVISQRENETMVEFINKIICREPVKVHAMYEREKEVVPTCNVIICTLDLQTIEDIKNKHVITLTHRF
jgi:hypothetical protein